MESQIVDARFFRKWHSSLACCTIFMAAAVLEVVLEHVSFSEMHIDIHPRAKSEVQ